MVTRTFIITFICSLCLAGATQAQTVTIKVDAGQLLDSTGIGEPVNGLLQLIASPSDTFSAPTSSSYVTGDNVLVDSFAMNDNNGTNETFNSLNSISVAGLNAGEDLLLRFYPTLMYSASPTSGPPIGAPYGQVRSNNIEFGSAGGVPDETGWFVPASGSTVSLEYVTISNGGTYPNSTAEAVNTVGAGAIPEPATYSLLACGLAGVLGLSARKRRGSVA